MATRKGYVRGAAASCVFLFGHFFLVGCVAPTGEYGIPDRSGESADVASSQSAERECLLSYHCGLSEMCNAEGSCVPFEAIEFGEQSPFVEREEVDSCDFGEYTHDDKLAYAEDLESAADAIYGPDLETDGEVERSIRERLDELENESTGSNLVLEARDHYLSLVDLQDAADQAVDKLREDVQEVMAKSERISTASTFRPQEAQEEAIEAFVDLYDQGFRVVVASGDGGYAAHPLYEDRGLDFDPKLEDGRSADGYNYISAEEIEYVIPDELSDRTAHYRAASRVFQATALAGEQLGVGKSLLESVNSSLDRYSERSIELRSSSFAGPAFASLEHYLDEAEDAEGVENARQALITFAEQDLSAVARIKQERSAVRNSTADPFENAWAFAKDHEVVRARAVTQRESNLRVDCGVRRSESNTGLWSFSYVLGLIGGLYAAYGVYAVLALIVPGVIAGIIGTLSFFVLFPAAMVGLVLGVDYLNRSVAKAPSISPDEAPQMFASLLRAVAQGVITMGQMDHISRSAAEDETIRDCLSSALPEEIPGCAGAL